MDVTKRSPRKKTDGRLKGFLLLFTLPTLALYAVLYIWPFIYAFYLSLFRWKGYSLTNMIYAGLYNYKTLFSDNIVWIGLKNNLFFLGCSTIVIFFFSLLFAVALTRLKRIRHPSFYRVIYFFPNVLSIIVVGVLWMFIYNPNFGLLNGVLQTLGLDFLIRDWLGDKGMVMSALIAPQAWMYIGFYMILFIAAIQNVPEEYYESAVIDGAGQFRQLFFVTIPLIWGTLRTAFVFFVVNAFARTFALVYVVTGGGPNHASELLTTYLYDQAFTYSNFGYGSAIGVFLFAVVCVISMIVMRVTEREVIEY
ncbi:MAG: sugar ABC transporter permease [Clostridia bacterium]